jgi:DNA topoisomerase II
MPKGKRLNPFEWARKRPDTCIGSVKTVSEERWVFDNGQKRAIRKTINFNPGLFNVNREIGSNIIDNGWRSQQEDSNNPMKKIGIDIDEETGQITMMNDGYCIPVRKEIYTYKDHRTGKEISEELYPAETFFGDMFAGTNYDDDEERKTSGRNGMGAKAANVFSTKFIVEHTNPQDKKKFYQEYTECGMKRTEPKITKCTTKYGYTKISFIPDYDYFKYPSEENPGVDQNFIDVMKMYAYEIAMITGVTVKFNGEIIRIDSLEKYVRLFYPGRGQRMVNFRSATGDECVVIQNEDPKFDEQSEIDAISFVNGIQTSKGGIHVDKWKTSIVNAFVKKFNATEREKKSKTQALTVSYTQVLPHLLFFIRTEVDRPSFESQTKDKLVDMMNNKNKSTPYSLFSTSAQQKEWNSQRDVNFEKMMKWDFIGDLRAKALAKLDRTKGPAKKKRGEKLALGNKARDANKASDIGKESLKCALILTEGLSAKTFAERGNGGNNDYVGTFALKGNFLNVQNKSRNKVDNNVEIRILTQMLGVRKGVDYSDNKNFKTLRYGEVWIMTDADSDGDHIRGLVINFFYIEYPSLLQRGYVKSFITPILDVVLSPKNHLFFYSEHDFMKWRETTNKKKYQVKYYKGLGSIDRNMAPRIFVEDKKQVEHQIDGTEKEMMSLGFLGTKTEADRRKVWLTKELTSALDDMECKFIGEWHENRMYEGRQLVSDFINNELKSFQLMCLRRAIPCLWDGLKESQRKILYVLLSRTRDKSAKISGPYREGVNVSTASGAVKESSEYHHGADSLEGAIISMGRDFVGSNNVPLIDNLGTEFGSREEMGKDHSAPRYISCKVSDLALALFDERDTPLYEHILSDGKEAEYRYFMPILPVVLFNGCDGIACGFSTKISNYDPLHVIQWVRMWINKEDVDDLDPLQPWYWGYTGKLNLEKDVNGIPKKWTSTGKIRKCKGKGCKLYCGEQRCKGEKGWWHITELGLGVSTVSCKSWIEYLYSGAKPPGVTAADRKGGKWETTKTKYISNFREYNSANKVHFMIKPCSDFDPSSLTSPKNFKTELISSSSLTNMYLLDEKNYPHKFRMVEDILGYFCEKRLYFYVRRRDYMLKNLQREYDIASGRYRFVKAVRDKEINLGEIDEGKKLDKILEDDFKFKKIHNNKTRAEDFEYLLGLKIRSMTPKKLEELRKESGKYKSQLKELKSKTPQMLWLEDIDNFEKLYLKFREEKLPK